MSTTSLSRSAALFRAVLLCAALSACGGGGGDAPAAPAPVDPPAPPIVAPPAPAPAPAPAPFAYLLHPDKVEVCQIDSDDLLKNCVDVGGLSGYQNMSGMAVAGSHAYIANIPGGSASAIIHCAIGTTGTFSGCAETGPADLSSPYGLAIRGSALYIGTFGSPVVQQCAINPDGSLGACASAGFPDTLAEAAEDFQFVGTRAYVLNYDNSMVFRCEVRDDGALFGCAAEAGATGLSSPEGFTIHGNHMYVANSTGTVNTVSRCIVADDGSIGTCVDAGAPGLSGPTKVVIRGSTAYITNADASVGLTRCTVADDGLLTGCSSTPGSSLYSIAIRQ